MAHGFVMCNVFKGARAPNNYRLHFDLDIGTKDKKVKLLFEEMQITDLGDTPLSFEFIQLVNRSQTDRAAACLHTLRADLVAAINTGTTASGADW